MKETIIFDGSDYLTKEACDEAAKFLKETNVNENPNYDDCYIFQSERMNIDFDELKKSLSMNIGREIIGLATVRVWNGYRKGTKRLSENLSNIPHIVQGMRWGKKLGDWKLYDVAAGFNYPGFGPVSVDTDNEAKKYAITREEWERIK